MKRLKASAALVCTLLMGWSQIIQPYSAYALSGPGRRCFAVWSRKHRTSTNLKVQALREAADDASGSQGVTEVW